MKRGPPNAARLRRCLGPASARAIAGDPFGGGRPEEDEVQRENYQKPEQPGDPEQRPPTEGVVERREQEETESQGKVLAVVLDHGAGAGHLPLGKPGLGDAELLRPVDALEKPEPDPECDEHARRLRESGQQGAGGEAGDSYDHRPLRVHPGSEETAGDIGYQVAEEEGCECPARPKLRV